MKKAHVHALSCSLVRPIVLFICEFEFMASVTSAVEALHLKISAGNNDIGQHTHLSIGLVFDRGYVAFHMHGFGGVVVDVIWQFLGKSTPSVHVTGDKYYPTLIHLYYMRVVGLDAPTICEAPFPKRVQRARASTAKSSQMHG